MGYLGTLFLSSVACSFLGSLLVLATYFFNLNPYHSLPFHSYSPVYHPPFCILNLSSSLIPQSLCTNHSHCPQRFFPQLFANQSICCSQNDFCSSHLMQPTPCYSLSYITLLTSYIAIITIVLFYFFVLLSLLLDNFLFVHFCISKASNSACHVMYKQ